MTITHEEYFLEYHLSVEQYGEILVEVAFRGKKMPDNHKGYDIKASLGGRPARIEVKSKLAKTPRGGPATVVHCGPNKLGSDGMTHLAVILVRRRRSASVKEAWLLTKEQAQLFRNLHTKSNYINVNDLRNGWPKWRGEPEKTERIKRIDKELQAAALCCA
jgi:hypothetical protein